ncbi:MAG: YdeI/OmpD-associated family protein [Steroidobacteraceae bacterium]
MKNPAVDAYIAKSAEFARPILTRVRALMHRACPRIEETMKWGVPHFEYKGIVASMAAFKQHAAFGFWKQRLLEEQTGFTLKRGDAAMGGRKIVSPADLPTDAELLRAIKAAVELNDQDIKLPNTGRAKKPPVKPPADLLAGLRKNAKAKATFDAFPQSKKRDYVDWITEAKQEATRRRRLATAIEWMAQGKARHWKYENC